MPIPDKRIRSFKKTLSADETICFIDGFHPHNTKPAYGWIQRGLCKEIPTNTERQRLNLQDH